MGREIKFRAWHPKWHEMIISDADFDCFAKREFYPLRIDVGFSHYPQDDKWVLMQFTGLRDKNGVEIYEGDVVEVSGISPIHHKPFNNTAVIEYSMGGFYPISTFSMNGFDEQNIEVIGNIWDNPELLEVGTNGR